MGAPNMSEREWLRDTDAKGREIFKPKPVGGPAVVQQSKLA